MNATADSGLIVTRKRQYPGRMRTAKIVIDGRKEHGVKAGESVTLALEPGPHTVQIWLDWASSHPLEVQVTQGQFVRVLVEFPSDSFLTWIFRPAGSISVKIT